MLRLADWQVVIMLEDAIVEVIESAVFNGKMDRPQSRQVYDRLAVEARLGGLALVKREFRKLHPYKAQLLKDTIQFRRSYVLPNGKKLYDPVIFPSEEKEGVATQTKGSFNVELIHLLQAA